VNEIVVITIKGTDPLPEVMGVGTTVVLIGGSGGGGTMPPPAIVLMGVRGLLDEVAVFSSITC
jgi:hypothetical protein